MTSHRVLHTIDALAVTAREAGDEPAEVLRYQPERLPEAAESHGDR